MSIRSLQVIVTADYLHGIFPGHPAHRTTTITTSGPQSTTTSATTFCVPEAPRDAGLGAVGEDVVYHDADDEVAGLDTVEENLMQPRRT